MGFFKKLFGSKGQQTKIALQSESNTTRRAQLEDEYVAVLTATEVTVTHPRRPVESIRWEEIEEVLLANTDDGPFLPDVWMVLKGNDKVCSVPQGSHGWDDIYNIVSKYPGFNFEAVIASASCTTNELFVAWRKENN